jgi:hypothetical protein
MTSNNTPQERIRALMDEDPIDLTDAADSDVVDDALDAALADAGLQALSVEAQDIVLALTSSVASLEPATRERLVKAAGRGLRTRRDALTPLPRLLFLARQTAAESIESVATSISVGAEVLLNVERGQAGLETLEAQAVATWVSHFAVPIDQAREALAKALQLQTGGDRAAASAVGVDAAEASQFFRSVMDYLQPRTDT